MPNTSKVGPDEEEKSVSGSRKLGTPKNSREFGSVQYSTVSSGVGDMVHEPYGMRNVSPDSAGEPVPTPIFTSVRFRLALVCWFGMAVMYAQRTNLSIAMVCMVKTVAKNDTEESAEDSLCPELEHSGSIGDFDWDKTLQGNILGSFFYGYLVLQLPGGILSERLGAKHVIAMGMVPVAVLTLLTPVLTRVHYILLIITRVIIGLGQAVVYPAITALWAKWSPPMERTMLVGISLSGGQFGNAVALPVGGLLCAYVSWDSVFYVIGGFGMLFCVIWILWVTASPSQHKSLSKEERIYLERTVPTVSEDDAKAGIPWKSIFTSMPVWAIIAAHALGNYTYYMNMTQMPTYMKEVLKFNIKSNGAFSMLPYLVFWLAMMAIGVLSDVLIGHNIPMVVVRKAFAFLGLIGPAAFMIVTAYLDCTLKYVAVVTLCCAVGMTGFGFASYMVNHGDLAPDYAGTLFGISNTLATLPGFVAPTIVGALTPDGTDVEWRRAFFVAAGINALGAVLYVLMGSSTIQPWSAAKVAAVKPKLTESEERMEQVRAIYLAHKVRQEEKMQKTKTLRRVSAVVL